MNLSGLKPPAGQKHVRKRIGRGMGSGHTTVPPRHDGEPCFEISAQNLMLSCGMRIQVPSGAERFGHRSLSEGQVLVYKAVHKEFISKCKGIARRGRYHYALH